MSLTIQKFTSKISECPQPRTKQTRSIKTDFNACKLSLLLLFFLIDLPNARIIDVLGNSSFEYFFDSLLVEE